MGFKYKNMKMKKLIKNKGFTYNFIAEKLDINRETLRNCLNNPGEFRFKYLPKLAVLLDTKLMDIVDICNKKSV